MGRDMPRVVEPREAYPNPRLPAMPALPRKGKLAPCPDVQYRTCMPEHSPTLNRVLRCQQANQPLQLL
jgi:hypothetical protein